MRALPTALALTILTSGALAGTYDGGTQSPFSLGVGARELSLGGAGLATADPATSPYWNPARLAEAEQFSLAGFHVRLFDSDVAYQYLGVVAPTMDYGVFGFGVFRLGVDGIEVRDDGNALLGETSEDRLAFYLSYGRTVAGYDLGVSITLEQHSLDQYKATSSPGVNLSLARRFEPGPDWLQHVTLALSGRNIIRPELKLAEESIPYHMTPPSASPPLFCPGDAGSTGSRYQPVSPRRIWSIPASRWGWNTVLVRSCICGADCVRIGRRLASE